MAYNLPWLSNGSGLPDFGWQLTESNTGLARLGIDGQSLDLYTGTDTPAANTTITLKKITLSGLYCENGNITFDRCLFAPTSVPATDGYLFGYGGGSQQGNLTIKDCTFDATAVPGSINIWAMCAIRATGTFQRLHITGFGSGIAIFGSSNVQNALVEHCYIHNTVSGGASHNEAFTVRGFNQTSCVIRKNRFLTDMGNSSAGLFIQAYAENIQNVSIEDTLIDGGGGWDLYIENGSYGNTYSNTMDSNNNRFITGGFGYVAVNDGPGFRTWTNNYVYDAASPPNCAGSVVNP